MNVDERHSDLWNVIDPDAALEQIATGFRFVEGPVWHRQRHDLIFSDIVGDTMYRWQEGAGISVFRQPSNMANGNTYDRDGRLLTCEHATSRVVRATAAEQIQTLASHYNGKELNSPNDIVVHSSGTIYFTDPLSGRTAAYGVERAGQLGFQGVYRLDAHTEELTLLADDFVLPNGLCFSLDEQRLFVNDTRCGDIRVFDVLADGTVGAGSVWATPGSTDEGAPDGMKIDARGNVWCTGPGGLHVYAPDATLLGVLRVPERVANFAWGDDDLRSLYITASTSVYRVRLKQPGVALF